MASVYVSQTRLRGHLRRQEATFCVENHTMPVPSLSQSQTLRVTEDFHPVLLILFYFLSSFLRLTPQRSEDLYILSIMATQPNHGHPLSPFSPVFRLSNADVLMRRGRLL
ncbi:hypothetical protein OIDMADRAFT_16405 [Oidiodendron maius Zn]|uniref:Uncharacterized protein n=1 Tax=Oidiodendron maius (strain Zn) TaxID=913774 RepID=A0A0C3D9D7_OIDMZ|nr:hypothetical protein OIDMADRAFT_16405 [Oidiodendron maius Zn]